MSPDIIFSIVILVFSVVLHEVSHGFAANYLGDPTARLQGRLTLNPVKNIDPMGSVILPAILALSHSPILFGWAKPVPYNPYNLTRGGKWAEAIVAAAGPASNFALAVIFGLLLRFVALPAEVASLVLTIVFINTLLGVFNLVPIPPLDGSKVLGSILPHNLAHSYARIRAVLERNAFLGFGIVILFISIFGNVFFNFVTTIVRAITGV